MSTSRLETTRLLAKVFNIEDFLSPDSLSHDELNYYNSITRVLDRHVDKYVDWLGTAEAQEAFYQESVQRKEYFNSIEDELDEIINDHTLNADRIIEKIYRKGLNKGYKDIKKYPVFNDACKYGLKATQDYNFELITKLTDDLRETIKHDIFKGIAEEKSLHEVARSITDAGLKPLEGKTLTAYQRASLIARTELARSMSTGRLQAYANYGVEKVRILTAGDSNVCPICRKAADKVYTLKEAQRLIPFHPACRCSIIAVIEHVVNEDGSINHDVLDKLLKKPISNVVMNLTPLKFHDISDTFDALPYVQLKDDKFPNDLPNLLKKGSIKFDVKIKNATKEYGYVGNLTTGELGSICSGESNSISLKTDIKINYGDELIATHNHRSHIPFNYKDFKVIFEETNLYVKYLVVHTPTDIFICELEPNAKYYCKEILDEIKLAYAMGLREVGSENYSAAGKIWERYKSNEILNKYMSFRRVRK